MNQEQRPEGRRPRKHYTEEFKRSVVDHWKSSGKTAAQIVQEFGVNIWNLRDWNRQYRSAARPVDAPMPKTPEEMSRQIQQLRKELARVTMQRDILKKRWASSPRNRRAVSNDRSDVQGISDPGAVRGVASNA